jgi:hypothetical protein
MEKPTHMIASIEGKIEQVIEIRTSNGSNIWGHIIITPAKGEYSYPNTVQVMSERKMGDKGAVINAVISIRGRTNRKGNQTFYNVSLWEVRN